MDAIRASLNQFKRIPASKKSQIVEDAIAQLSSAITLLDSSSPSIDTFKGLSNVLRHSLQPLFVGYLPATLNYVVAVLKFIHYEKVVPILQSEKYNQPNLWEPLATSAISGVLDYLENHPSKKSREAVASALHPTLCAVYFCDDSGLLSSFDGNLLSYVYLLLGETLGPPGADAAKLRDKDIGSHRLGRTIAETKNYLALESLLELLGRLIPSSKGGKEKRNKFLKTVFDPAFFKCTEQILQTLQAITPDWNGTTTKIIKILAESDIRSPQPFEISLLEVQSIPMATSDSLFVDNKSFLANLDQDEKVETLQILFTSAVLITVSAHGEDQMKVVVKVNQPPILGNSAMPLAQQEFYIISFSISKAKASHFWSAVRRRKLTVENPAHRKLSKAPSELLPDVVKITDNAEWQAKAAKLKNMAKHGRSDPPNDINGSSSPPPHFGLSSLLSDGHRNEVTELPSNELPSTVFLDGDGNLSMKPPAKPINSVSVANYIPKAGDQRLDVDDPPVQNRDTKQALPKRKPRIVRPKLKIIVSDDDHENVDKLDFKAEKLASTEGKSHKEILEEAVTASKVVPVAKSEAQVPIRDTSREESGTKETTGEDKPQSSKKRTAQDDVEEFPSPKRACLAQSPISNPRSKQKRYGAKGRRPVASPMSVQVNTALNFDFDVIPKPKRVVQTRARAMKSKQAAEVSPVVAKKNSKPTLVSRNVHAAMTLDEDDEIDHDKTLVERADENVEPRRDEEGRRSTRQSTSHAPTKLKSATEQKDKGRSSQAPWERESFLRMKEEIVEDMSTFHSADDLLPQANHSTFYPPPVEVDDISEHNDEPFRDKKNVDFEVPFKGEIGSSLLASPQPKPVPKIVIDLTNSPPVSAPKMATPTTLRQGPLSDRGPKVEETAQPRRRAPGSICPLDHDLLSDHAKPLKLQKTVEKFPTPPLHKQTKEPESVSEIPRKKEVQDVMIAKFPVPLVQARRKVLFENKQKSSHHKNTNHLLSDVEEATHIKSQTVFAKEQVNCRRGRAVHFVSKQKDIERSEINHDPDERIAAILGEINEAVLRRIKNRFTGVTSDLLQNRNILKRDVAEKLREMHFETVQQFNNMVDLHEEYTSQSEKLLKALDVVEKTSAHASQACQEVIEDFSRNSLCNKFPASIIPDWKALSKFSNRQSK